MALTEGRLREDAQAFLKSISLYPKGTVLTSLVHSLIFPRHSVSQTFFTEHDLLRIHL